MTAISLKVTSAKLKVSSKVKFDRGFYKGECNSPAPLGQKNLRGLL